MNLNLFPKIALDFSNMGEFPSHTSEILPPPVCYDPESPEGSPIGLCMVARECEVMAQFLMEAFAHRDRPRGGPLWSELGGGDAVARVDDDRGNRGRLRLRPARRAAILDPVVAVRSGLSWRNAAPAACLEVLMLALLPVKIHLAIRSLGRNPMRSLLTMLGISSSGGPRSFASAQGVTPDSAPDFAAPDFAKVYAWTFSGEEMFSEGSEDAVIGRVLADRLFGTRAATTDKDVEVRGATFRIVGMIRGDNRSDA